MLYIGAFLIAILWLGTEYNLGVERDNAIELSRRQTANLARVFEDNAHQLVGEVDSALKTARMIFEEDENG